MTTETHSQADAVKKALALLERHRECAEDYCAVNARLGRSERWSDIGSECLSADSIRPIVTALAVANIERDAARNLWHTAIDQMSEARKRAEAAELREEVAIEQHNTELRHCHVNREEIAMLTNKLSDTKNRADNAEKDRADTSFYLHLAKEVRDQTGAQLVTANERIATLTRQLETAKEIATIVLDLLVEGSGRMRSMVGGDFMHTVEVRRSWIDDRRTALDALDAPAESARSSVGKAFTMRKRHYVLPKCSRCPDDQQHIDHIHPIRCTWCSDLGKRVQFGSPITPTYVEPTKNVEAFSANEARQEASLLNLDGNSSPRTQATLYRYADILERITELRAALDKTSDGRTQSGKIQVR